MIALYFRFHEELVDDNLNDCVIIEARKQKEKVMTKTAKMEQMLSSIVASFRYDFDASESDNQCVLLGLTMSEITGNYLRSGESRQASIQGLVEFSKDVTLMLDSSVEGFVDFHQEVSRLVKTADLISIMDLMVKMNLVVSDEALLIILLEHEKICVIKE